MQGKLDHYNLTTTLAKKYSHLTYLASSINEPEQQVIVIMFPSSLFSLPHEHETLLQKAQHIKELQHPHLLPILDMGIEREQPFVVRSYLPNGSLRSHLKQISPQQLELHDALNIVLRVGEALAYAHRHNIFHGNLKPENILFDANGKVLLTDFTLVSRADAMIRDQTSEEYAFCYMAPEQFAGTWNACSDQYALGSLTYELLTGQLPFATQTLASMMGDYNNAQPIPLSEKVANLPPSLNTAVLKTLAKEPDERFFDFSLFLEVIRSVLSPPPTFPLLRSTISRNWNATSHPMHSLETYPIVSSSRQSVASPSPMSETSEAFTSSKAEYDLAELSDAPATSYVHILKQVKNTSPSDDFLLINPFREQENNELHKNHIYKEDGFEMDGMTVPLLNRTDRDISLKRQTQRNRRKIFRLVPFGFLILAFVIAAWSNYTAFLPLKTSTLDILVHQNPTQVTIQTLIPVGETIPSTTPTIQPTMPSRTTSSTTPTIQPTMPNKTTTPTPTPTRQPTVPSKTTPTSIPTPTPTPTHVLQTTTIDDSVMGTGLNQFNYVGSGWSHGAVCPGYNCRNTLPYNGSNSWDRIAGDYMTISFTGVQIQLYGIVDAHHGIGAVSIDEGIETMVDFYASVRQGNQLLWTSPTLPAGTHTFKLRATGNKHSKASNTFVVPDRVDILS